MSVSARAVGGREAASAARTARPARAAAVARAPVSTSTSIPTLPLQRCACGRRVIDQSRAATPLRRKCARCAAEEELQRHVFQRWAHCERVTQASLDRSASDDGHDAPTTDVDRVVHSGWGQPLDRTSRAYFEPRFGRDLGDVRIHTGASADVSARSVDALAYTVGEHIVVRSGYFAPQSDGGQRLLAHELTHTAQQRQSTTPLSSRQPYAVSHPGDPAEREAERVATVVTAGGIAPAIGVAPVAVGRQHGGGGGGGVRTTVTATAPPTPPATATVDSSAVTAAVDIIIDRLKGYTSRWDSADILQQFIDKDPATTRAMLTELERRGAGNVRWMFNDMTAEDASSLRTLLIQRRAVAFVSELVAEEIENRLSGYTSEEDSREIVALMSMYGGADLDDLLATLVRKTRKGEDELRSWLFGDLDRANAWRLAQHFYGAGGPTALRFAAGWSVEKIYDLLAGYTSHSDSSAIVRNFQMVPPEHQASVLSRLDEVTHRERQQSAQDSLMHDMDRSDYERLRTLPGMKLGPWVETRRWWERGLAWLVGGLDWAFIIAQWIVCGAAGIITGVLSVIWDFVRLVRDIVVSVYDLLGSLVYLISGGAAGSAEWLAVKQFFKGIGHLFTNPGEVIEQMWADLKLQFETIEGPLTACRTAEFVVRKFVYALVNIILIFVAGYGAVKAGLSGIQAAREFMTLARQIGLRRAILQVGRRAARAMRPGERPPATAAPTPPEPEAVLRAGRPQLGGPRLRGRLGEVSAFEETERLPPRLSDLFPDAAQRQVLYGRLERGELSLRDFAQMLGPDGAEQVYFRTPQGGRWIDHVFASGDRVVLRESKNVVDLQLTGDVQRQVAADLSLLDRHPEAVVHWRISGFGTVPEETFDILSALQERTVGRFRFQVPDGSFPPFEPAGPPPTLH